MNKNRTICSIRPWQSRCAGARLRPRILQLSPPSNARKTKAPDFSEAFAVGAGSGSSRSDFRLGPGGSNPLASTPTTLAESLAAVLAFDHAFAQKQFELIIKQAVRYVRPICPIQAGCNKRIQVGPNDRGGMNLKLNFLDRAYDYESYLNLANHFCFRYTYAIQRLTELPRSDHF